MLTRKPLASAIKQTFNTEKLIRVGICVPSQGTWKADFGNSLMELWVYMVANPVPGYATDIVRAFATGTIIPHNREVMAMAALEIGCTHVLMLDSDMTFPPDTFHRLIKHKKDIVACNCPSRDGKLTPTARTLDGSDRLSPDSSGLVEVQLAGTGIILISTDVFKALQRPWFEFSWRQEMQGWLGEDLAFCEKAREAGFKVHVDADLSKEIGHIGDCTYQFLR